MSGEHSAIETCEASFCNRVPLHDATTLCGFHDDIYCLWQFSGKSMKSVTQQITDISKPDELQKLFERLNSEKP